MKEFELPALEYCSLERAVRYIGSGCEVGDFLHWAEVGAIHLSHEFGNGEEINAYIEFESDIIDVATKIFNTGQCDDYYINLSEFSIIATSEFEDCQSIEDVVGELTKYSDKPIVKGILRGVWDIQSFTVNNNSVAPYQRLVFSPMGEVYVNAIASINNEIGYAMNDFLVSKKAIALILGDDNKPRELSIKRKVPYLLTKDIAGNKEDISITIANNRASMIKALLAIHYGDDVANSPRKFIESRDSEICKDFNLKGIELPSGKTVASWLKDADIDFS
ncbi:hypothetical protein [Serratia bockelmannii]|uniref:hypothetical protein n=1 Tax=Serratia bockelmannii TaxID=2703793 RepID=UPI0033162F59